VDDLGQVRYLQLCPRLVTLTLEGNLVCLRPAPGPSNKVWVLWVSASMCSGGVPIGQGPIHIFPMACSLLLEAWKHALSQSPKFRAAPWSRGNPGLWLQV
jgi:hypothetical protein